MTIREYNALSLPAVAAEWYQKPEGWVPISRTRAWAMSRNPRADEADVALVTAEEQGRLLSFIGVLPDRIRFEGRNDKVGWLSSWWVDPTHKRSTVAAELFYRVLERYEGRVGVSTFSESAGRIYKASGKFTALPELVRVNYIFRLDLERHFWRWAEAAAPARWGLAVAGGMVNPVLSLVKRYKAAAAQATKIPITYLKSIDEETDRFINRHNHNELSRRAAAEYDWILHHPMTCPEDYEDRETARYPFHLKCRNFSHWIVRVHRPDHSLAAVCLLLTRDNALDVKYCHYDDDALDLLLRVLWGHALRRRVRRLSLYDERLQKAVETSRLPFLYKTVLNIKPIIGKVLESAALQTVHMQGGDGDSVLF